ncbi:armadillo-type protein [Mycena metata]|uniref:Armadillo-type protein n=1 Tax=Mycena metata TaxID=1033252 RepID=A0AAD7K1E1_9AGAR|nr:armadillo-type protein [Mycena metata]
MPPLTRQRTPQSLHSEWSRSTLGATISIHAFAKPLMKFMYHRAVLELIKHQRDIPLSAETMQIYTSYLRWKYVAETTKTLILEEIYNRVSSPPEAHVIVDFLVSYELLLDSKHGAVRNWTSQILGRLASHPSTRGAVVTAQPCPKLVALLGDDNAVIVERVCSALSHISHDVDGATAVVEAGALETVQNLLTSPPAGVQIWTVKMLAELAFHPSTRGQVVAAQPCPQLVALLGDDNVVVVKGACYALSQISRNLGGARAVIEAGALETIQDLLTSPLAEVRRWTSNMLTGLAFHPSTRRAIVTAQLCPQLVALLGDDNAIVVEEACCALLQISRDLDGAKAVVEAGAPGTVQNLFTSRPAGVRRWISKMLAGLAFHPLTRGVVIAAQPCPQLVALLGHDDAVIVEAACYTLLQISADMDGAKAVVEAGPLETVEHLLESQYTEIWTFTRWTFGELASRPSTQGVVVTAQPCSQLVALLGDDNAAVIERACCALSYISCDVDGARAVVEARALETVENLFTSPRAGVRRWTAKMLAGVAFHPSMRGVVVAAQPCPQLVTLLSDDDEAVVEAACYALSEISRNVDGANAVVEAGALGAIEHLLASQYTEIRRYAC